jgi:PhzF family phenazine biosynthesis protein
MKLYQVDAFSPEPFAGNPAAVCMLQGPADESWMQNVAREMNLSETAFLFREGDGFNLRWFTPAVEVNLCGHATLASAHILWEEGILAREEIAHFSTKSGLLKAAIKGEWIELDFPLRSTEEAAAPPHLIKALGVIPVFLGKCDHDYLVEIGTEEQVRAMKPDFALLMEVDAHGIMVTASASTPGIDFVSRYFAPREAINEDPVTGSAHCGLGPYWKGKLGKNKLVAFQASERGGLVRVLAGNERVFLSGQAVTIMKGTLLC